MVIVDKAFQCQHKEKVNMSKDEVSRRAWLRTARIWLERMKA